MAEPTTLARPYAKAAFEFARDVKALDRWSNMLATVASVAEFPQVQKLLQSPNFSAEEKGQRLVEICGDDVDNKVSNFIMYLARNDRLPLLDEVRELFELLKAQQERTIDVDITTAFAIDDEQQNKLANALKAKLQRDVKLQTSVDHALLGGAVIRAGDLIIDGSIRGRLEKLADTVGT